jgi:hypothetical protein
MNEFKLIYDKNKKIYYVCFSDKQLYPKVSINHLINPNNREKWLKKNLTTHIKMLEWLRKNHSELLI